MHAKVAVLGYYEIRTHDADVLPSADLTVPSTCDIARRAVVGVAAFGAMASVVTGESARFTGSEAGEILLSIQAIDVRSRV